MTTSGSDFHHDELEPEQIEALLQGGALTANEVVEGLWHGQVLVRRNAAKGARFLASLPDPGEAMLRIVSKDPDAGVRGAIVAAVAAGLGSHAMALPLLFDAVLDSGEGIRDIALQGLEQRLLAGKAEVMPYFAAALGDVRGAVSSVAVQLVTKAGGPAAIPPLVALLGHGDARFRRAAYDILDKLKWSAVSELIEALRDPSSRRLAGRLLGGLGEIADAQRAALNALRASAEAAGDAGLLEVVVEVLGDIGRPVEVPRSAPADVPIPGFFARALEGAELDGTAEVDEVLYALKDGRAFVRKNAAAWLGRAEVVRAESEVGARVVGKLGPVLRDADAGVRAAVAEALGALGGDEAARLLTGGLADTVGAVREAAVKALHGLGPEALAVALEAVRAADPPVVDKTFAGLREVAALHGGAATNVLADALRGGDERQLTGLGREVACLALADLGAQAEDAAPSLLASLDDPSEDVRAAAAFALGFLGLDDEIILSALKRLLRDSVPNVRRQAALAASRITGRPLDDRGASEPQPVPIAGFEDDVLGREALAAGAPTAGLELLVRALRDGREVVKQNAARAIGCLADEGVPGLDQAAQPLALLLRDGDAAVRRAAVAALHDLGKQALPGAWFLTAALNDPEPEVRDAVVDALVALHPEAEPFLVEALRTDTANAREGIFNVWYRLARAGVPGLAGALANPSGLIRLNAAWALEMLAKKGADQALGDLDARLADPIGQVRAAAQAAIDAIKGGKPRPPRVLEPDPVDIPGFDSGVVPMEALSAHRERTTPERMVRALRDGRAFVRENAARMIGLLAEAGSELDTLRPLAIAARDDQPGVRRAVVAALAHHGPGAAPLFVAALEDKDQGVRDLARAALDALGVAALPALVDALQRGPAAPSNHPALPHFARLADRAVPALTAALDADSPLLRAGALRALRVVGRDHAEAVRSLVLTLEGDRDDAVRAEARALHDHLDGKDVAPPAAEALPIPDALVEGLLDSDGAQLAAVGLDIDLLLKASQDGREVLRANAARAIGRAPAPPKRAGMALAMLLRDGEPEVRRAAAEALDQLGAELTAPVAFWLTVALADPDLAVRDRVANVLAAVHALSPEALVEGLRVDSDLAWETILLVFDRLGASSVPTLAAALRSPSGLIRINAAQGLELLAKRGADAAIDELEARLSDPIGQVRVAAARAIDAIKGGRPRPPRVLEPDPIDIAGFSERLVDDATLAANTDAATPERLRRAMRDGRPWVRANAARLLPSYPASDELTLALPTLAVLARDAANEVKRGAVGAIGRLVADERAPLEVYGPVLVQALGDRQAIVRKAASEALAGLGERAFPALALGLADADERTLGELVPLFQALGDAALAALPDALSPLTPELHLGALTVLLAFSREGLAAHRPLVEPLASEADPRVREAAVRVLDKIDGKDVEPAAAEPVPLPLPQFADVLLEHETLEAAAGELRFDLLARAMNDGRDLVRANAATGLEVLGSARELAWPYLTRALKDPSAEVRARAARALGVLPPRRDVAFELVRALDDRSPRVVTAAEDALRAYGEFALDAFMFALDDEPDIVGKTILPMLATLGAKAVDKLVLGQRYDSPLVRRNCLIGLRLLDKELARAVRPTVAHARKDEDRAVRLEALHTLDWIDGLERSLLREPRVLPTPAFADGPVPRDELAGALGSYDHAVLAELLFDGRRAVRENAATAFGVLARYHPWLGIALKDSVDAVQLAAATTLLELGDAALPSAPALIGALLEDDAEVRETARKALLGLGKKALPALVEGLWAPADVARKTVVPFIEALGADATPTIIAALGHPSQLVVLNALNVLGRLYGKDQAGAVKGMARVQALVKNPLPAIIGAAQKCLFRLEGRTPAEFQKDPVPMPIVGFDKGPLTVDVLRAEAPGLDVAWMISAFSDGRPIVRENAARAAGFMPKALKDLLGPLTIALKDAVPEVQVAAADAFASLRAADDTAIPALTFALRNATDRVKRACMVALDAYGPERVAAELVKHLVGREDWMLVTIGRVAARMPEVLVPALARFAKNGEASLVARENAVRVLADLGLKARAAEPTLLTLLPEMEGMLACKAAFALGCVARPSKELIEGMQARLAVDPRPSLHHEIRSAVKILKRRMPVGAAA